MLFDEPCFNTRTSNIGRSDSKKRFALAVVAATLLALLLTCWSFGLLRHGSMAYAQGIGTDQPPLRLTREDDTCVFTASRDARTELFEVTSGDWRVSYEFPDVESGVNPSLLINVLNEDDESIDAELETPDLPTPAEDTVEDTSISGAYTVTSTPGAYYLEILGEGPDREYVVTVSDCAGPVATSEPSPQPAPQPTPQPAPQPAPEPIPQPAPQPTPQPAPQPQQPPDQERGTTLDAGGPRATNHPDNKAPAASSPEHHEGSATSPKKGELALSVPRIGLSNVIVPSGTTQAELDREGIFRLSWSGVPWAEGSNTYIVGHRMGYPRTKLRNAFRKLDELKPRDRILVEDHLGRRYVYEVYDYITVPPTHYWLTHPVHGKTVISLQTCTPIPTFEDRLVVRGELVNAPPS